MLDLGAVGADVLEVAAGAGLLADARGLSLGGVGARAIWGLELGAANKSRQQRVKKHDE